MHNNFLKLLPKTLIERLFALLTLIILPFLSFSLASHSSLFYENLTYIGNKPEHRLLFQIWGVAQSLLFYFYFIYWQTLTKTINRNRHTIAQIITLVNISSFFIPYSKSDPILSNLHVYTSLLPSVFTIVIVMYCLKDFQFANPIYFSKNTKLLSLFITLLFLSLFLFGDISTISELLLTNFLNFIFYHLVISYKNT